jgi:hypothetical protein
MLNPLQNKKYRLLFIGLLLVSIPTAYGAWTIVSSLQHVAVFYQISAPAVRNGKTITITATLTDGTTKVAGATLVFYKCDSTGNSLVQIGSGITDAQGIVVVTYQISGNGDYYFIVYYTP